MGERRSKRKVVYELEHVGAGRAEVKVAGRGAENSVKYNGIFMEIHANGQIMRPLSEHVAS